MTHRRASLSGALAVGLAAVGIASAVLACDDTSDLAPAGDATDASVADASTLASDVATIVVDGAPAFDGRSDSRPGPAPCDETHVDCNGDPSDGCETDLTTPNDCGACRRSCAAVDSGQPRCERTDRGPLCRIDCTNGRTWCNGECVDTLTTAAHCGGCNRSCGAGNPTCSAAACSSAIIATGIGAFDGLAADARGLVATSRDRHQMLELTRDGQLVAQRDEDYSDSPMIIGDQIYWISGMYGGSVELRRRHRLSTGSTEAFGRSTTYSLSLFRDGDTLHWIASSALYRASTLYRFDLTNDAVTSTSSANMELFPIGVANNVLFAFMIPYMGAGAYIFRIDYSTGQWTDVGDGGYGARDACPIGDQLVWVSTAGDLRTMPIANAELPKPIPGVAPLTPRRMLCDGDRAYVGADDGGNAVVFTLHKPSGTITRIADGKGTLIGAIAKFGEDLYWTLPTQGAIAHQRL